MSPVEPRTLAEQLRSWSDEQLSALLTARPDLTTPMPPDSAGLASRATSRGSLMRVVDDLDVLHLAVADALVVMARPCSRDELVAVVNADPAATGRAIADLVDLALVWGTDSALRPVSALGEVIGDTVSRLGPPVSVALRRLGPSGVRDVVETIELAPTGDVEADLDCIAAKLSSPLAVESILATGPAATAELLARIEASREPWPVTSADAHALEWLEQRGLVAHKDRRHVLVPREVGMALRGGHTTRARVDEIPSVATVARDEALVDRTAAGAALDLTRHVELLLEHWAVEPAAELRGGGVGVRDMKALATLLHVEERHAALVVEVAHEAGLLGTGIADDETAWMPTDAFDVWLMRSASEKWALLAKSWLDSERVVGLIGRRVDSRTANALGPDLERSWAAETRHHTLVLLSDLPRGEALASGTGVASAVECLRWHLPRRPAQRSEATAWTIEEAAWLGILGAGGMSAHGRALLDKPDTAADTLTPLLPTPIDHVLLQADLTAVAPGPLEASLARSLGTVADIESRGGATVYRFSEESMRRAFDAGWSADELHAFLAGASRTPVPQPLTYLVDDVARRFGTVRAGMAEAFLRSDDEHALTELLHHPKAHLLRLRRIAPTVLISDVPLDLLLPRIREIGVAPVVEAADGTVRVARPESKRARNPRGGRRGPTGRDLARRAANAAAALTAIRAGDRAESSRPRSVSATSPAAVLSVLREAVESGTTVWVEYVDRDGGMGQRLVEPQRVEGGWLTALDERDGEAHRFAVHRIHAVHAVEEGTIP